MSEFHGFRRASSVLLFVLLCVAAFGGCNRGPRMVQVSGKVFYKDGTVPHAGICMINFTPVGGAAAEMKKVAGGAIGPDGSFSLTTRTPNDGAYVGEYAVTFTVIPGPMDQRQLITQKYVSPMLTPYKVNLDSNTSDLKFEIEPLPGVAGAAVSGAPATDGASKPAG